VATFNDGQRLAWLGFSVPGSVQLVGLANVSMAFQVDDITIGGVAPVYAISVGCVADGTEKSTHISLEKLSLSVWFVCACALQP
jgi:hypothetical protein